MQPLLPTEQLRVVLLHSLNLYFMLPGVACLHVTLVCFLDKL